MNKNLHVKLPVKTELVALSGIIAGVLPATAIQSTELSKLGGRVLEAIIYTGSVPPYSPDLVEAAMTDVLGLDRYECSSYIAKIMKIRPPVDKLDEFLRELRKRRCLLNAGQRIADQLSSGKISFQEILTELEVTEDVSLTPVSDLISEEAVLPSGLNLKSLPMITEATGGLFGLWVVAGNPKVGKSTLALQIALEACKTKNVLYYDFENGFEVFRFRLAEMVGPDLAKQKRASRKLYYRSEIATLEQDINSCKEPPLVIIDSFQKLPFSIEYQNQSMNRWLKRFEKLKTIKDVDFLIMSEKSRETYEKATMSGFKGSGDIEYSAWVGAQLVETGNCLEFVIVANRNRAMRGRICTLRRDKTAFWFAEGL